LPGTIAVLDALAAIEGQATCRTKSPYHQTHAACVFQHEPVGSVRQHDDPGCQAESMIERLGVPKALGWGVVEEYDVLGHRHCTARPGDHGQVLDELADSEHPTTIEQDRYVSTRYRDGTHPLEGVRNFLTLAQEGRSLQGS